MKYTILILWTFSWFLLMFSSFPFRVECRPTRALGPGPPPLSLPQNSRRCPFTEFAEYSGSRNSWAGSVRPHFYPPDITVKVWEAPLLLEGTARSKSEVGPDGTFGVTFDLIRVVKGDAPVLVRRKQFRLQFLDNPPPKVKKNSTAAGNPLKAGFVGRNVTAKAPPVTGKCLPPKATVKTGRKYFVFAAKWGNHFVALFSPDLANKKNWKAVEGILCKGCGQAPSVGAKNEMVLKPKERLRLRCRLRAGNPVPTLTWYKDGRPVNLSDTRTYRLRAKRRQSILVIRKAKESDVGVYKCEAKNVFGSAHATIRATLQKNNNNKGNKQTPPIKTIGTTPTTLWPLQSSACPYETYGTYCLNGGTCSYYDNIGEFVCQCAEGYKGQRCDTKDIPNSMYLSYFCIFGPINPDYPCQ